jgi:hypothetical protein
VTPPRSTLDLWQGDVVTLTVRIRSGAALVDFTGRTITAQVLDPATNLTVTATTSTLDVAIPAGVTATPGIRTLAIVETAAGQPRTLGVLDIRVAARAL